MLSDEEIVKKVKDKGYVNLSGEERKRYQSIKNESSAPPKKDKDTITIKKIELQDMINQGIENYRKSTPQKSEKYGEWKEIEPGQEKNKTAKLKMYQENAKSPIGVVVRVDYFKTTWNEETHRYDKVLYEMEVLYDDGKTKTYEIDAVDFAKLNQTEEIELIDVERKKLRQRSGKIGIPMKDKDGYPLIRADHGNKYGSMQGVVGEVDLEVIRYDEKFKVKRPNGQTFEIHSKYLNN